MFMFCYLPCCNINTILFEQVILTVFMNIDLFDSLTNKFMNAFTGPSAHRTTYQGYIVRILVHWDCSSCCSVSFPLWYMSLCEGWHSFYIEAGCSVVAWRLAGKYVGLLYCKNKKGKTHIGLVIFNLSSSIWLIMTIYIHK